jgi:hypothetical protein
MRRLLLLALVASLALSSLAQKKKDPKRELPDQVLAAQFIYVTGWHGDLYNPRVPNEERTAVMHVQEAVRAWGRYRLVFRPEQADMMMVVKAGHLGMVQGGISVGSPPDVVLGRPNSRPDTSTSSTGVGYGGETGNPGDYLMVSMFPAFDPVDASYVWKRSSNNGFVGRKIPLLEEFKKAVDASEKAKAAATKP